MSALSSLTGEVRDYTALNALTTEVKNRSGFCAVRKSFFAVAMSAAAGVKSRTALNALIADVKD